MKKTRFRVEYTVSAEIEISDAVLALPKTDPEGRYFKSGATAQDVAEHLAYNMLSSEYPLSALDGFADRADNECQVVTRVSWDLNECVPLPKKQKRAK